MQSWAALEEGSGDAEQGEQLRDAGRQAALRVRVPRNFASGFAIPPTLLGADEPSPLASIQQQVGDACACVGQVLVAGYPALGTSHTTSAVHCTLPSQRV